VGFVLLSYQIVRLYNMKKINILLLSLILFSIKSFAQYAPQAPLSGHEGIYIDDARIKAWANGCTFERGWLNIANKALGQPTIGNNTSPIGMANNEILSLGDSGVAVLTFEYSIKNEEGPDFAVFENGFANPIDATMAYMELAFVEVSSDGINYFRFDADCQIQDTSQIDNFTYSDATKINNLAGKYIANYGTPFDLEELKDKPGLDVNNITHIRIVDCIGSIDANIGSKDANGRMINDPYTTEFPSGGFDLNAVAVLNSNMPVSVQDWKNDVALKAYPNPVSDVLHISTQTKNAISYSLTNILGQQLAEGNFIGAHSIDVQRLPKATYLLKLSDHKNSTIIKIAKH